ncbi:monovalent cation/H+ antiporter subunit D family protein [Auritidibacter ignavus]|uniref:Monovalent cation/H+ antiporter subunit D family protein n=1 Tax=Auritidibacter ignavus TaxID=678932 RepID=A0AAJ6AK20_9MICC|nr:monovalent cation/H+ antiporter subunit D family protein [Auritidibacter ignavus]NIH70721.1 multicomponent Na+:H+ antiporter subunit D [Auritidibacter ignavus]WGH93634.1 monovalent cation/H+ antiporter subunit D family protein [Auritidibacter ignavus]WHS28007.1 monovalent cation/H+ antiporter subunit D family protein [Auritidibacter ignavus]
MSQNVLEMLLPMMVAVPLLVGGALAVVGNRLKLHAWVMMITQLVILAFSVYLVAYFAHPDHPDALGHSVGLWPYGVGIPFVADMFSALMLTVTSILTVCCTWFALASYAANSMFFAPLVLILGSGVNGAFLTADLFNLFVFLEVMLLPSYGLYVLSANRQTPARRVHGARLYVTLNLFTSTLYMIGVGFLYGTAGSVNIGVLASLGSSDRTVAMAASVCLLALGIKAAIVPLHGWLARSYPATSPAITALFSGLHTKVAIYAIYRLYAVIFDGDTRFLWVGVLLFCLTMVIGVLGAVGEKTTRTILAFHMVSQIGYILLGVALFTELGLTAGIFYLLHHMIVKASLFLSTGAVEVRYGTGVIGALGGIVRTEPWVAGAFLVAALSLAGIPPFSGFMAKFLLILGAVEADEIAAVVVMVVVSLVTLLSMLKIWSGMFWEKSAQRTKSKSRNTPSATRIIASTASAYSDPNSRTPQLAHMASESQFQTLTQSMTIIESDRSTVPKKRISWNLSLPAIVLAGLTICLGLGAQLLLTLSGMAAEGLLDTSNYLEAVMNG